MSGRGYPQRGRGGPPGGGSGGRGSMRGSPEPGRGGGFAGRGGGGPSRGGRGGGPRGGAPAGIFQEGRPLTMSSSATDVDRLIRDFKAAKLTTPERPLRPGYGTAGTEIKLRANFFAIKVPKGPVYDYVVTIRPATDLGRLKARIFQLVELDPVFAPYRTHVAHDKSQRIVSAKALPQPLDIQVRHFDEGSQPTARDKTYTVSIVFERELDMSQLNRYVQGDPSQKDYDILPLISALNLILQQRPSQTGVRVGKNRHFFNPEPQQPPSLGIGLAAWQGFFTSVRPVYKQLMVNVNVCMTAFIQPGSMVDALQAFSAHSRGAMPSLPKEFARGLKVTTSHLGYTRRYALKQICTTSARNTFFDLDGKNISVENYFKKTYNIQLRHAHNLPVIDAGSKDRPNYIPAELCNIAAGQPFRGRLSDQATASMIRVACNPPNVNAQSIVGDGFTKLGLSPASQTLNAFGITIDTEMAVIPARELPPPTLSYRGSRPPNVNNGSWNILDVKFHRGATVKSWWVLVVRDETILQGPQDPRLKTLVEKFGQKMKSSGMNAPDAMPRLITTDQLPPLHADPGRLNALAEIRKRMKEALAAKGGEKPSFVLVLLSKRDNYIYPGVKASTLFRIGDVELGIQTVHMQLGKCLDVEPNKQDQYLSNIALKVNTKLGGMNHLLDQNAMKWLTKKSTMLVGIDVTHPGPTSQEGTPSIAAVVASTDDSFVQFPCSIRIQESRQEMVDNLSSMLIERLKVYEAHNKKLPDRIFVFRDGVSEGQYPTVLSEELPQICDAFKRVSPKKTYKPALSIIICGKRHHARFYPTESRYAAKNGNTRPGTVVDKGVTAVFDFDFYLQAHAGLQGSVKPTHYIVIYDECGLTADEIQQGTNNVSYLYARATKAVSLMPPAYYADLACERGRCYLNEFLDDQASSVGGGKGRMSRDEEKKRVYAAAEKAWGQGIHPDIRGSMFYI